MRQREPDRVIGLYDQEKDKCRLIWVENGVKRSRLLGCRVEAERMARSLRAKLAPKKGAKVADVLVAWAEERNRLAQSKPQSTLHLLRRLRCFLSTAIVEDIRSLTPDRAAKLYEQAIEQPTTTTGSPPSAATHRYDLWAAKFFFKWAKAHGYVSSNPFADVRAVGKVRVGKPQLRLSEARKFTSSAIQIFEETGRSLPIAALMALSMGLRTGEVLERVVRDLDDDGRFLWVDKGKTENARRHLEVPEPLRPFLLRLARGQPPDAPLFRSHEAGGFFWRSSLHRAVRELCDRAGVPRVCTHSLRGLWATLAVRSGAASHAVAATLGHRSFEVTQRHYAQPSAVANAQTARVTALLSGEGEHRTLEHLLAQLPPALRAQVETCLGFNGSAQGSAQSLQRPSGAQSEGTSPTEG